MFEPPSQTKKYLYFPLHLHLQRASAAYSSTYLVYGPSDWGNGEKNIIHLIRGCLLLSDNVTC